MMSQMTMMIAPIEGPLSARYPSYGNIPTVGYPKAITV
jgi:hypothetical protein